MVKKRLMPYPHSGTHMYSRYIKYGGIVDTGLPKQGYHMIRNNSCIAMQENGVVTVVTYNTCKSKVRRGGLEARK